MSFYTLKFAASVEDANIYNSHHYRKEKRQEKRAKLFLSQRKSQRCARVNFNKEVRSVFETKLSCYHFDLNLPKKSVSQRKMGVCLTLILFKKHNI